MKTYTTILFVLLLAVFSSCNNSDDTNSEPTISGEWNLTHISGGLIIALDYTFQPGEITWTFNEMSNEVTIVNNSTQDFTIFDSGTYSYSIQVEGEYSTIIINDINLGSIEISEHTFTIDQRAADGILIVLER